MDIPDPVNERTKNELERSTMLLVGRSTISMAIVNSYISLPAGMGYVMCMYVRTYVRIHGIDSLPDMENNGYHSCVYIYISG